VTDWDGERRHVAFHCNFLKNGCKCEALQVLAVERAGRGGGYFGWRLPLVRSVGRRSMSAH
jgi:hypothetical protein